MLLKALLTFSIVTAFAFPAPNTGAYAQRKQQQSVTYACPMHPEVTSKKPGKCPKCGTAMIGKGELCIRCREEAEPPAPTEEVLPVIEGDDDTASTPPEKLSNSRSETQLSLGLN